MNASTAADKLFYWAAVVAWALFVLMMASDIAHASSPFEDPDHIRAVASRHAQSMAGDGRNEATARLPDSRLRLKRCDDELATSSVGAGQRVQVQVSCPGVWKIYVPVTMKMQRQLVVAKRSLRVNEVVSASDLVLEWRELNGSGYGHFESLDAVVGRELARPVRAGQIVQPHQVRQAMSIRKGDVVTLLSRAGSVEIRGRGRAEEDAVENTRLRVRNLSSGRIVEGYARPDGIVEIQG